MPPKRPASASTAARCSSGSIVVRTAPPRRGATEASTRSPARSAPPGRPARSASNWRSSPVSPTGASGGTPRRASSAARSGGAGPTRPAISDASAPSFGQPRLALGQRRAVARLDRGARRQRRGARQRLARPQPRMHEVRPPVDGGAVLELDDRQRDAPGERSEDARAQHDGDGDRAVARVCRAAGFDLGQRRHLRGAAVGGGEALEREPAPRLRRQHRVHHRVIAALPGLGERARGVARADRRRRRPPRRRRTPRPRRPPAAPAASTGSGAGRAARAVRRRVGGRGARGGWTSTSLAALS